MKRLGMSYNSLTRLDFMPNSTKPIKIKILDQEKEYYVISETISRDTLSTDYHMFQNYTVYEYELQEIVKVKLPTKEEIAAQESVAKAKEALKAAENALKVIKDKK